MDWDNIFIVIGTFEIILVLISTVGNSLIILIFFSDKRLKFKRNFYLISLTFANLLTTLGAIPFSFSVNLNFIKI